MTTHLQDDYNPNAVGRTSGGIFGLPYSVDVAEILVLPVPWEVTASYGGGCADGPDAIVAASSQLDLHHPDVPELWKVPIAVAAPLPQWRQQNDFLKPIASKIYKALERDDLIEEDGELARFRDDVNLGCGQMVQEVKNTVRHYVDQEKKVVVLGGDHSVSLGAIQALAASTSEFGILQIDAHMDLREAYAGFTHSHASVMRNVLETTEISKLIQMGPRDFCDEELAYVADSKGRISVFDDYLISDRLFSGDPFSRICSEIVACLPEKVYISVDIDGLDPSLCPNTGTPVPGGLSFRQATYLISALARSGREIIGADLVEVSSGNEDWDGNVGARMVWYLIGAIVRASTAKITGS